MNTETSRFEAAGQEVEAMKAFILSMKWKMKPSSKKDRDRVGLKLGKGGISSERNVRCSLLRSLCKISNCFFFKICIFY